MDQSSGIAQFIPIILLSIILGILMAWVASKLDKNKTLWFFLGATPFLNFMFVSVAVWIAIIGVHRRVKAIEEKAVTSQGAV